MSADDGELRCWAHNGQGNPAVGGDTTPGVWGVTSGGTQVSGGSHIQVWTQVSGCGGHAGIQVPFTGLNVDTEGGESLVQGTPRRLGGGGPYIPHCPPQPPPVALWPRWRRGDLTPGPGRAEPHVRPGRGPAGRPRACVPPPGDTGAPSPPLRRGDTSPTPFLGVTSPQPWAGCGGPCVSTPGATVAPAASGRDGDGDAAPLFGRFLRSQPPPRGCVCVRVCVSPRH